MSGETQVERRISGLTILASNFQLPHRGSLPFPRGDLPFPPTPHLIHSHHPHNTPLILPDDCNSRTFGTCLFGEVLIGMNTCHAYQQGTAQHPIPLFHRMRCV
jgi:hypothetical protein